MPKVAHFLEILQERESNSTVSNPYSNAIKTHNLEVYLRAAIKKPHVVFIGEAQGYHGCTKIGIPALADRIFSNIRLIHYFNRRMI